MHECGAKYRPERSPRTTAAPSVDDPVLMVAGRTMGELVAPLGAALLAMVVVRSAWLAATLPPLLWFALPAARRHLGRGRARHLALRLGLLKPKAPHNAPHKALFTPREGTRTFGP